METDKDASQSSLHSSQSTGFVVSTDSLLALNDCPRDCYLTAQAEVNDVSGIVLLDTGSGVTIISSSHWKILGVPDAILPYRGPVIQGPDGSSIGPEGEVSVRITMAGITIDHRAILAKNFHHLVLLGNDYMKSIGLVLDLQANKMWLRNHPTSTYAISSDVTHAGRIDIPVLSHERRTIAPYHIAFLQVNIPSSLSSQRWDASITSPHTRVATANSLIRFNNRKSFVQVANCSPHRQYISNGQLVGFADLYSGDTDTSTRVYPVPNQTSSTSSQLQNLSNEQNSLSRQAVADHQQRVSDNHASLTSSTSTFLDSLDLQNSDLTSNESLQLQNLINKYQSCFQDKPGHTSLTKHHIDTGSTKPIKLRPYRVSPHRQQIITQQIHQMLIDGIIEPANGPYAAPVTLQPKKDGSLRFCVDFRELNAATIRDVYPIPRIDDTLDQLHAAKYFTSLDLKSGFWQIELDDESRPKTAFTSHAGLFQFKVMPFGLTNAPATFQRLMDLVLGGLKWSCALVYLDDIIVYSPSFDSHLHHLESVLQHIQSSGLSLQILKCHFAKTKLKYLGHVVSSSGIEPDPDKIRAVRDYPIPARLKDVRTFLGLTSYYRRFIKNYATIAEPLLFLTRNSEHKQFSWSTQCQNAFLHLRQLLIQAPIIAYPRFDQPFILQLDASDVGLSAILAQNLLDADGIRREHVIGYASRTLSPIERRYSPTERECLAIVYGCSQFRPYLEGVRFTILTDHRALRWLRQTKDLNSRLARWAMQIAAYDVDIQHRPGSQNTNCDALSRAPVDSSSQSIINSPSQYMDSHKVPIKSDHCLLLNYFHCSSLPPPQLTLPIPLLVNTIQINAVSPTSLPFSSIYLANLNFVTNTHLYEELREAQWQDSQLLPLLNYLQHQKLPDDPDRTKLLTTAASHRLVDGVLYRVLRSSGTLTNTSSVINDFASLPFLHPQQQLRLVVPTSKIRDVLSLAHDHPTTAHLGRRKTLYRLSSRFTWPRMRRDVIAYVQSCTLCQRYKSSNQFPGGLMQPIVVHQPWNTVGIDLTGPLPKTRHGNTYILVVIDYFTKWVELFALADIKAKTIAQVFIDEVVCRFGFPVRIISDNGVQFVSSIFTNVCQSLGIKHHRTPLYHPQSNLCERVNRTLKPLLAALAHHDQKSWDTKLPQIAFALRTAPSDSTEQSPAFLMFGRHPRQALDLYLPSPANMEQLPNTHDLSQYRKNLLNDLMPAYASTRELLDLSHQRQTRQYNQRHRPLQFEPGDLVWVTALSGIAMGKWRGPKLGPRWDGPYLVIERLSSLTYSLEHTLNKKRLGTIHVSRIKPYYTFASLS
jgi:transposase InsO family protein